MRETDNSLAKTYTHTHRLRMGHQHTHTHSTRKRKKVFSAPRRFVTGVFFSFAIVFTCAVVLRKTREREREITNIIAVCVVRTHNKKTGPLLLLLRGKKKQNSSYILFFFAAVIARHKVYYTVCTLSCCIV